MQEDSEPCVEGNTDGEVINLNVRIPDSTARFQCVVLFVQEVLSILYSDYSKKIGQSIFLNIHIPEHDLSALLSVNEVLPIFI